MCSPGFGSDCVLKVVARKGSVATVAGGSWEHLCAHLRPTAKGEPLLVPWAPRGCHMAMPTHGLETVFLPVIFSLKCF